MKIMTNTFNSKTMNVTRGMVKTCTLVNSKGDIWAGVGSKLKQFADDGEVVPRFSERSAIGIRAKR